MYLLNMWFYRLLLIPTIYSRQLDILSQDAVDKTYLEVLTWKSSMYLWWLKISQKSDYLGIYQVEKKRKRFRAKISKETNIQKGIRKQSLKVYNRRSILRKHSFEEVACA